MSLRLKLYQEEFRQIKFPCQQGNQLQHQLFQLHLLPLHHLNHTLSELVDQKLLIIPLFRLQEDICIFHLFLLPSQNLRTASLSRIFLYTLSAEPLLYKDSFQAFPDYHNPDFHLEYIIYLFPFQNY